MNTWVLVDGLCMGEEIMKVFTLSKELNMPFVGGSAAEYLTFTKPTFVGVDEKCSSDSLAVIIMKMKIPFFYNHYVQVNPTNTSFVVTKADPAKRIVWEINGEPAAPYYAKLAGVSGVDKLNMNIFMKNPLGIVVGETTYVRSFVGIIEGTGLQFFCYIEAGTKVFIMKPGDIIDNTRKALRDAESYIPNVCGAILFNCVVRYLELQELRKIDAFNSVFSHLNFIGFNAYGEELFTYHNQTLTAIFFGRN
ncbi:MAG: FIST C-terminal domain-containing protein [Treponema sp.]|nr:FIST C-terminal domain-containing protein [Treponema sp.]